MEVEAILMENLGFGVAVDLSFGVLLSQTGFEAHNKIILAGVTSTQEHNNFGGSEA